MNTRKMILGIAMLIVIGLLSFVIRAHFVWTIVDQDLYQHISIPADGKEYIHLAQNIATSGTYADSSPVSRYFALLRTPGYPVFLSIFEYTVGGPVSVFWAQTLLSSMIPMMTAIVVLIISGSIPLAFFAGILGAASATGVYQSGQIMADLLLAFAFLSSFTVMLWGIVKQNGAVFALSGAGFGIAALIKPILLFWPIGSLFIVYLFCKAKRTSVKPIIMVLFCALQIIPIITWCGRNYVNEDLFSLSTISIRTLRQYLGVQVEVNTIDGYEYGSRKFVQSIMEKKSGLHRHYVKELKDGASLKVVTKEQLNQSLDILRSAPIQSVKFYLLNVAENLSGLFLIPGYFLKLPSEQLALTDKLLLLDYIGKLLRKICYPLMILFVVVSPFINRKYQRDNLTMITFSIYSLILTILYFSLLSGVTFWTGPRIVFPADFAMLISGVLIYAYCIDVYRMVKGSR